MKKEVEGYAHQQDIDSFEKYLGIDLYDEDSPGLVFVTLTLEIEDK